MTSNKEGAALLADIFVKHGLSHIVISPGSRNAPLIVSFVNNPSVKALSIVDERSAAFFAMGMAQQTKKTVAITCTSGSAVLNYAPAIAEAFYQKVPLLIITADRPSEMIDQGDGQTIRQKNVFANYVKKSFEIQGELVSEDERTNVINFINEAIELTTKPDFGPVHINMPFAEPIYGQVKNPGYDIKLPLAYHEPTVMLEDILHPFADKWRQYPKKLLIAGMMDPNPELKRVLKEITRDGSVALLTETTSNLFGHDCSCSCIDKVVHTIKPEESDNFKPDLLISFGGHVVSKMVKAFIRNNKPKEHWHIDPVDVEMNTYQCLSHGIPLNPVDFFKGMPGINSHESGYKKLWIERANRSEIRHDKFLENCEYSDLKVFELILNFIPEDSNLQLGNSTPVRYSQLFKSGKVFKVNSNRGTSGIDGTVSTAAGAAWINGLPTILITGDLGFLYDSNALMNHHLTENLRIIVINNHGGGIFRFISGPDETNQLEKFFEAKHSWNAEYIAKNFNVSYYNATNLDELALVLPQFFNTRNKNRPAILEVFTPHKKNAEILKSYFNYLRE
ncbi:MAG: 2-succinyl-5-enolpyruvyl-6-hydroxy-3-cyclohexene-1-carboxylic-acid synthase [Bacteroidales bacterium]|nr:2-succinyl-5-enolpyruvyl-6-hydroxy-3-cyclohexene-1-carboxylic-acid synthase [Bacteroidales bacterium]